MPPAKKAAPAAKKSAPAKAAAQATVTLKHLAAELADSHDLAEEAGRGRAGRSGDARHEAPQEG